MFEAAFLGRIFRCLNCAIKKINERINCHLFKILVLILAIKDISIKIKKVALDLLV